MATSVNILLADVAEVRFMSLTDLAMVSLVVLVVAVLGLWAARRSVPLAVGVVAGLSAWLLLGALLASAGVLSNWTARPPRMALLAPTALLAGFVLSRTSTARAMIASTPLAWPVAFQTFRVLVELVLFALYRTGRAPVQVTFEGRNLDVLVGLTAPLLAWWVARRRSAPGLVVTWNVLGLAMLANTVFTVVTSLPGPQHLHWPGAPFTAPATWPVVWLPSFLAPLAATLHAVSLQQTIPLLRANAERQPS
jgi:hypothetical protein